MKKHKPKKKPKYYLGFELKNGKYLGKSIKHWERVAKELVVDSLNRAGDNYDGIYNLAEKMARDRLYELANLEDPAIYDKKLKERDDWIKNATEHLNNIFAPSKNNYEKD